jgi:glutamate carboxypeptidase
LHALKMLKETGWQDYAKLTVLFNSDEEIGSVGSGELIASLSSKHDYVYSCEPSPDKPEILLLGAAGTGKVTLRVQGRAAHAGVAPELGRNALVELAHQIQQTQNLAKEVPGTQLNWTMAEGGRVLNQIPATASASGDMRLTAADGFDRLEETLKERVKNRQVPDTVTQVVIERGRPPFVASSAAREFAKMATSIYSEIGRQLTLLPMTGGATDAGFAARSGRCRVSCKGRVHHY